MMRVKALKSVPVGFDDGIKHLVPGEIYSVSDDVAESLIRGNDAEAAKAVVIEHSEQSAEAAPEIKPKRGRPRIKDRGAAPENK